MSRLLEQAIAKVRELPEDDQDAAAEALFAHLADDHRRVGLTPEQIKDVLRIQRELGEGGSRLATDDEMAALWKKCGL